MKRSEIQRRTELQRAAPLGKGSGALKSSAPTRPREFKPKPKPPKRAKTRAESDPEWTPARLGALDRDGGRCCRCGHRATEVHHRISLQMGGSTHPDRHRFDKLVSLCSACHGWAHGNDPARVDHGYVIEHHVDAWTVPLLTLNGPRWLTPTGVVAFTPAA